MELNVSRKNSNIKKKYKTSKNNNDNNNNKLTAKFPNM